jgi:hypothetical protein
MTTFPTTLEHTRNYLVNIQVFGDKITESEPAELNYIATSFDINYSGGADFVHQKGRKTASAFAMQPTVSVNLRCYMSEPEFSVIVSNIITNQQHILLTVGKLRDSIKFTELFEEDEEEKKESDPLVDSSATIYEVVGYMKNARITATAGDFIVVEFTVNADEINEFDPKDLLPFKP